MAKIKRKKKYGGFMKGGGKKEETKQRTAAREEGSRRKRGGAREVGSVVNRKKRNLTPGPTMMGKKTNRDYLWTGFSGVENRVGKNQGGGGCKKKKIQGLDFRHGPNSRLWGEKQMKKQRKDNAKKGGQFQARWDTDDWKNKNTLQGGEISSHETKKKQTKRKKDVGAQKKETGKKGVRLTGVHGEAGKNKHHTTVSSFVRKVLGLGKGEGIAKIGKKSKGVVPIKIW